MRTWRPNQSGTFSNRVNVHDKADRKLFVIEFYTDDIKERQKIMSIVENAPELLEALQELKLNCHNTAIDGTETYYKAVRAINKALS